VLRHIVVRFCWSGLTAGVRPVSAAVCLTSIVLTGCSSRSTAAGGSDPSSGSTRSTTSSTGPECVGCPPPRVDVSVVASLNGATGKQLVHVRPGAALNLAMTMTVGRGDTVSSLQVGTIGSQPHGFAAGGPCGILSWVLQRQEPMGAGSYHFATTFVAQPVRGHDVQPMSVIAVISTSAPSASVAPNVASYTVAPITPEMESTAPTATPACP
jgi:hypothetical protein